MLVDGQLTVLAEAITGLSAMLSELTIGANYEFVVEARNEVGFSPMSDKLSVHLGYTPDPPRDLSITNVGDLIEV